MCNVQYQPSQVGSLFTFLARQGARYRTSIRVDEHVYDQVVTNTDWVYCSLELYKFCARAWCLGFGLHHTCWGGCCQWRKTTGLMKIFLLYVPPLASISGVQALLELWHAGVLKKFDEEKLLVKAEAARLWVLYPVVLEYLVVKINILSTTATVSVSYFTTKSETLPWFYHATSGTKQEGWEWKK